ncbi:MAG: response regulator, partial [Planctomycetota bacterium]
MGKQQQQSLFGVRGQASAPPRQQALFKPMARAAADAPLAKLARSRPRALVVEDERAIGELVQRVVAKDGYEAALVLDPAEALRRLAADPSRYELLLLDLTLPGFDGCELARRARRLGVTGRIVVVSGLGEQHARARCAGVDVDAFVSKPFTPQALRAATGGPRRDADAV